jgi:oxygen-independent coproporphyrinogen-3 oxidase
MHTKLKRPLNSLYIHVPFCKSKCYYCNFISLVNKNNYKENYINAVLKEIEHNFTINKTPMLDTIYFGGGTPSLLEIKYYDQIISKINKLTNISKDTEITVEINPGTIDIEYLKNLKTLGVNRLSVGVQSFDDKILKSINRIHSGKEAIKVIDMANSANFDNISIDLMYGLPNQNKQIWENTLNQATELNIKHISTYGLKIEEGTIFGKNTPPNLPDEDMSATMYTDMIDILKNKGFNHYEISNFALSGFESKHNLAYWHNEEYFGIGLAAHGYVNGIRYANTENIENYINNPLAKCSEHKVNYQETLEEGIFLGLRLIEGINLEKFKTEYNINLLENYREIIKKHISNDLMDMKEGYLKLTQKGILISNSILADFID